MTVLKGLFSVGPIWFGLGFVAPLLVQVAASIGVKEVVGVDAIYTALLVGGGWGALATRRGKWV